MRSRVTLLALTLGGLLGVVVPTATAAAAQIQVNRACFADPGDRKDTVQLTGTGFTPGADYQVTLDGQPLAGGSGQTDATGAMSGSFIAPSVRNLPRVSRQHRFRISVQEGDNAPETTFTVSRLFANFSPAQGNPSTLRVRFNVFGFALQGASRPPVYVHYLRPGSGSLARTVRLGTAGESCGHLQTKRRRLFGFTPRRGTWKLQFDTSKTFRRGSSRSSFLYYALGVKVR
jgi:hypothetical protein